MSTFTWQPLFTGGPTTYNQSCGGTITPAGSLFKDTTHLLGGTITPAGALVRNVTKILSGTLNLTGSLVNSTTKILAGVLSFVGTLGTTFVSGGVVASVGSWITGIASRFTRPRDKT